MEDYINPKWNDAVEIGFNERIASNSEKIVAHCEKNYILHGHQWRCDFAGKCAILQNQEKVTNGTLITLISLKKDFDYCSSREVLDSYDIFN